MYFWYNRCLCLILCFRPEVIQGLSLYYKQHIAFDWKQTASLTFLLISSLSQFISPISLLKVFLLILLKILTLGLSVTLDLTSEWSIMKFAKWSLISVIKLPELTCILEFLDRWKMWSISVQVWLVTVVGNSIVGIKPFLITVFKYLFVLLFKSNFIRSMLKSPVNIYGVL